MFFFNRWSRRHVAWIQARIHNRESHRPRGFVRVLQPSRCWIALLRELIERMYFGEQQIRCGSVYGLPPKVEIPNLYLFIYFIKLLSCHFSPLWFINILPCVGLLFFFFLRQVDAGPIHWRSWKYLHHAWPQLWWRIRTAVDLMIKYIFCINVCGFCFKKPRRGLANATTHTHTHTKREPQRKRFATYAELLPPTQRKKKN